MQLAEIIKEVKPIAVYNSRVNQEISGIVNDSRDVKEGSLFICITGYAQDGHLYAGEAVKKGAVALITERRLDLDVTQLVVENSRLAQALAVQKFYNRPSSRFELVGITGTNGKTTTSYMIEAILQADGRSTGVIGTINNRINDKIIPTRLTTPDAIELAGLLSLMAENQVQTAVMEVSSHALEQHRVAHCDFDVTVFTNISRDHFDLHRHLGNYLKAKAGLFARQCLWAGKSPGECHAVINEDDPYSQYFKGAARAANIYTYGFKPGARVRAAGIILKTDRSLVRVKAAGQELVISLPLPGLFNVYNALAAIAVGLCLKIDPQTIRQALNSFSGVPGRCEFIDCGQDFKVMVDFAHNPGGLFNVLTTIPYPNSSHRKIVVFGCEGGKDRGKRGIMGRIAARYADYCIITTDNMHQEDPAGVAREIEQGLLQEKVSPSRYRIILDRHQAIRCALELARPKDTVIIAGKGHETHQIINGRAMPFDDRDVVKELLLSQGTFARRQPGLLKLAYQH